MLNKIFKKKEITNKTIGETNFQLIMQIFHSQFGFGPSMASKS